MKRSKLKLTLVSDRKPVNGIDEALGLYAENAAEFQFIYRGSQFERCWSKRWRFWTNIARCVPCDVLYLRVDWFDQTLRTGQVFRLIESLRPRKVVVGIHCHLCTTDALEERLLRRADAFVFINEQSRDYFATKYEFVKAKPSFLMPSLFLPANEWYFGGGASAVQLARGGRVIVAVPGAINRLSMLPKRRHPLVSDEMSAFNRYDYLRLLRLIAACPRVKVRIFGRFGAEVPGYDERVESLYRDVAEDVEIVGSVSQEAYYNKLAECHIGLMTGYLPREVVPPFEQMNYQLRYNSLLKARVMPLLCAETCNWHEAEALSSGVGVIAGSLDGLRNLDELYYERVKTLKRPDWERTLMANSLDGYVQPLLSFFAAL